MPPLLAMGVVIVAACPGGMMSNMVVHLGGANTALSVTLTAMATTVTLITLPLWVRAILTQVGGDGSIEIPLLQTALELGGLTIVPVMVGMVVRHFWPAATRFERPLSGIAAIGILGSLTYDGFMRPDPPTDLFVATLQPMFWLAVAAIVLGLGVPRLLGQSSADAVTIAVELCLKNGLLGMVVASTSFGVLEPSIPILAYSGYMLPASIILLTIHRVRERRAIGMQMSQG